MARDLAPRIIMNAHEIQRRARRGHRRSVAARRRRRAPAIPVAELQARRAALAKAIGADAVFIAFSREPARRTGDVDWPFRQEDNLLYLTGMNEPDTTLVLLPGERDRGRSSIFARDRDPAAEAWTGRIPSKEDVDGGDRRPEVASPRQFNALRRRAVPGTRLGRRTGVDPLLRAAGDAVVPRRGAGRTRRGLARPRRSRERRRRCRASSSSPTSCGGAIRK